MKYHVIWFRNENDFHSTGKTFVVHQNDDLTAEVLHALEEWEKYIKQNPEENTKPKFFAIHKIN